MTTAKWYDPTQKQIEDFELWKSNQSAAIVALIAHRGITPWSLYRLAGSTETVIVHHIESPASVLVSIVLDDRKAASYLRRVHPDQLQEIDAAPWAIPVDGITVLRAGDQTDV